MHTENTWIAVALAVALIGLMTPGVSGEAPEDENILLSNSTSVGTFHWVRDSGPIYEFSTQAFIAVTWEGSSPVRIVVDSGQLAFAECTFNPDGPPHWEGNIRILLESRPCSGDAFSSQSASKTNIFNPICRINVKIAGPGTGSGFGGSGSGHGTC